MSGVSNEEEASEIMAKGAAVSHQKIKRKSKGALSIKKDRAKNKREYGNKLSK